MSRTRRRRSAQPIPYQPVTKPSDPEPWEPGVQVIQGSFTKNTLSEEERKLRMMKFLDSYADFPHIPSAAAYAKVSVSMIRDWRDKYPYFEEAFQMARDAGVSTLERTVWNRAKNSLDPGSHVLAIFLLKSLKPEVYNPTQVSKKQVEFSTKDGNPLEIEVRAVNYRQAAAALSPYVEAEVKELAAGDDQDPQPAQNVGEYTEADLLAEFSQEP